jgi:hypothetical protein
MISPLKAVRACSIRPLQGETARARAGESNNDLNKTKELCLFAARPIGTTPSAFLHHLTFSTAFAARSKEEEELERSSWINYLEWLDSPRVYITR